MMFDAICNHPDLVGLLRLTCRENDVGAEIHEDLLSQNGDPLPDKVLVLKLDAFYHSQNMHNPPPSPDYLVIVKCCNGEYEGYLIELRDTKSTAYVRAKEVVRKFQTAIDDFLLERFAEIFVDNEKLVFRKLNLFLVTDPLGIKNKKISDEEYKKKMKGTVLDAYGSLVPIKVRQHFCMIQPILPDPMIEPCS